ncbi:MAG: hypothetical protein ACLVB1_07855 [Blautia obeum]
MTEIRWYEEGKPHMRIKENKVSELSGIEQFPDIVPFTPDSAGKSGIYSR